MIHCNSIIYKIWFIEYKCWNNCVDNLPVQNNARSQWKQCRTSPIAQNFKQRSHWVLEQSAGLDSTSQSECLSSQQDYWRGTVSQDVHTPWLRESTNSLTESLSESEPQKRWQWILPVPHCLYLTVKTRGTIVRWSCAFQHISPLASCLKLLQVRDHLEFQHAPPIIGLVMVPWRTPKAKDTCTIPVIAAIWHAFVVQNSFLITYNGNLVGQIYQEQKKCASGILRRSLSIAHEHRMANLNHILGTTFCFRMASPSRPENHASLHRFWMTFQARMWTTNVIMNMFCLIKLQNDSIWDVNF